MTSDPYQNKPQLVSKPDEWHEMAFQISVDVPVDWAEFDLKKWATYVARFTALMMAKTTIDTEELEDPTTVQTLLMDLRVDRVKFVSDDGLHEMIDKFEE